MVAPNELRPNPWNSNVMSPESEAKLAESLRRLGVFKPIVVREKYDEVTDTAYEILGGEHRWQAAQSLGHLEVPIYSLGEIDDETAKKVTLADNARYGADDQLRLAEMLEGMSEGATVHEFLPFTEADVAGIFSSVNIALDELELDGFDEKETAIEEQKTERAPVTHALMRFKVPIADSERITERLGKIKKRQGFTASDDLTNAGDALVHALFGEAED